MKYLQEIFSRPLPDDELAETTRKLCSVYLNGVWQTISAKQMDIKLQRLKFSSLIIRVQIIDEI